MMDPLTRLANKRLAIFGCGYVGTELARQARAAGLRVDALTRNRQRAAELAALGAGVVVDDLAADTWHRRVDPGAEVVVNCVGSGGGTTDAYRHSYVEGMRSVLAWCRHGLAGTVLFTSSTSVYPQGDGAYVDEDAPTDASGESPAILLEAESLLRAAGEVGGRWFILRLAGIYGPGRHHLLDQLRTGTESLPGGGTHRLNLAHRDDVVAAILAAAAASDRANRIYNVADDAPATKREVVEWLADRLGRPPPRFGGGPSSRRRGFTAPPDRIIGNQRLKAELGWQPRYPTFREGYEAILSA